MEQYGGVPVWHASVAYHDDDGLVPVAGWPPGVRRRAEALLRQTLRRVGDKRTEWIEEGRLALHRRRRINTAEFRVIGPAVDVRGSA